ncbi:MAG: low affinity potassium transporter [Claussenomyces sp. TS43310]|nr:MAG: low affinity potassium transporter [Claussenomyces sp. TS43310]
MFLDPFIESMHHLSALKPSFLSKSPHFNFITVHYFWIIGWSIAGSILVYPAGNLAYIDALFLGSGISTQSGLNTVDTNKLNTYQQVVMFFIPMLTNPITINSFVVFLRLYWFEKRFQHIAREARTRRKTVSKSRSQMKGGRDLDREERGVNGRSIVVMHRTTRAHGAAGEATGTDILRDHEGRYRPTAEEHTVSPEGTSEGSSKNSLANFEGPDLNMAATHQTQIKFDQQVKRSDGMDDEALRLPHQRSKHDHIAVLERQRNPEDKGVLRIPGPRDQDAGMAPESIDEDESIAQRILRRESTLNPHRDNVPQLSDLPSDDVVVEDDMESADQPPRRNITIAEPDRGVAEHVAEDVNAVRHTLGALRLRVPRAMHENAEDGHLHKPQSHARARTMSFHGIRQVLSREKAEEMPYFSWEATVGRNSAFVDLSEQQREELGGIEYRSLKSLALILVCYFWGFWLFGVVSLTPWIVYSRTYGPIVDSDGQNRIWWGFFTSNSAFTDLGFTLTPDSMISFQTAIWPLLLMSFLIIIGNTGFPIMLRFIIWVTSKYVPRDSGLWEELMFLLDHPRRCFTLLFPSTATWWLFWILAILNGVDLVFFIILDLGNTIVTQLPVNIRVLDGWFQAASTRTAGFDCVNLAQLHPAIQVSYLVMMYISVLPIAISVRRTNVYEEKSLGIWGTAMEEAADEKEPSYVSAHLRRQLSFDLWYIFLGLFVISIAEGSRLQSNDPADQAFTLFAVLFEVVSAYGTVGLSLGYPTINASFSTEFGVIAKLIIIAMQIRGRHRGLPYELDRAILLPSENLHENENADSQARGGLKRRASATTMNGHGIEPSNTAGTQGSTIRRSRSYDRGGGQNFLSSMLHPGPTIPNSHRYHPSPPPIKGRSNSIAVGMQLHQARSLSPVLGEKHPSP